MGESPFSGYQQMGARNRTPRSGRKSEVEACGQPENPASLTFSLPLNPQQVSSKLFSAARGGVRLKEECRVAGEKTNYFGQSNSLAGNLSSKYAPITRPRQDFAPNDTEKNDAE